MKKIMLAAAFVCTAAVLSAAQFTWKSNYSYVVDNSGKAITTSAGYNSLMNGGNIVLVLLDSTALYSDVSKMTVLTGTGGDTATFKTSGGGSLKYGTSSTFGFSVSESPLKDGSKVGVMYQDATGALSQLVYWDTVNNKAGDKIDAVYTVSGMAAADPADTWSGSAFIFAEGTSTAKTYFTTSVPEPTSGLLLLLGMAGLALKRKRA
jgi:hypothetical protein